MTTSPAERALFTPLRLRSVTLPNRIGVSPMCMYAAPGSVASDFHVAHLGRFALGGAGLVMVEATAVEPRGRISPPDLGLWSDEQIPGLARVAAVIRTAGAVPGIQLAHAGRRASVREPWRGGLPLDADDAADGTPPWPIVGPSAVAAADGWPVPQALDEAGIDVVVDAWAAAARRAVAAGFEVIELHGAHGYLLHSFLSPVANRRDDAWGGDAERRMHLPLRVVRAVRAAIGELALLYRISAVDGHEDGLGIDDTALVAGRLREAGVDLIDVSSGGIVADRTRDRRIRRGYAFHADLSRAIRDAGVGPVATVGLVVDPEQAAMLVDHGDADLVLLGRQMLDDPNWALHARHALGDGATGWPDRYGSAIVPRRRVLAALDEAGETPLDRFRAGLTSPATG